MDYCGPTEIITKNGHRKNISRPKEKMISLKNRRGEWTLIFYPHFSANFCVPGVCNSIL